MQNDYYAAMEKQLKAFIASGFGQLALQIKNDFIRDREMIEQLRERISELEDRFNMVNGSQAGRGLTPYGQAGRGLTPYGQAGRGLTP